MRARSWVVVLVAALLLTGCGGDDVGSDTDPAQVDAVTAPELGACRLLTPDDLARRANATRTVDCTQRHTAETYAVGDLPDDLQDAAYDDPAVATWTATTCQSGLQAFLGADESLTMRSVLSWSWFAPSRDAWDEGARWWRCDAVGGDDASRSLVALPTSARSLLSSRPERRDRWMACASGPSVDAAPKVPCTKPHDWRAVGTIKVGPADAAYPGDTEVRTTSDDFCRSFVGGWLGYPDEYDYGYTWFREAEWLAGNRRSVCWARTTQ